MTPNFRLSNSVIRNPRGQIKFIKLSEDGFDHYHIGVWLEADNRRDLARVEYVSYELHPTFKKRQRVSRNRDNNFSITFWSWGTFIITATVHFLDGETLELEHELEYDLPEDDGTNYVRVN